MMIKKNKPYKMSQTTLRATWIDISDATTDDGGRDWHIRDLQCSNCGNMIRCYYKPFYCDVCGARMVNKQCMVLIPNNKIKGIMDNEIKSLVDILDNERPKGEWNYIQAGMCVCPFCGAMPHKLYKNYCAKCGAELKGGAE